MNAETRPAPDGQLSLKGIFWLMTFVAICLMPFVIELPYGIIACVLVMAVFLVATKTVTIVQASWGLALLFVLVEFFGPFLTLVDRPNVSRKRTGCSSKIRQIGLALLNYESSYGHFPPAYTVDANGKPLHCWRTLILPYMEYQALYNSIDFSRPWDDPVNAAAAAQMPDCYSCPSEKRRRNDLSTSYIGIIGEGLIWQNGGKATSLADMTDGTSNTLSVVEAGGHRVHWMSPNDLQYDQLLKLLQDPKYNFFSSDHAGGCNGVCADGSTKFLRETMTHEQLKAMLTISGGETITE